MTALRSFAARAGRSATRVLAALTVAGLLAACGGDDSDDDDVPTTEQDAGAETETGSAPADDEATASGDHPCDVVDLAALEALVGSPVGEGEVRITTVTENGLEWSPEECEWDVEDVIEMDLHLVEADDYADGEVVCPELGGAAVTAVDGLGDSAQWEYRDGDGSAHLRVCTATGMVDAKVEPEDAATLDSAALQAIATELAEPVLALL